MRTLLSICGLLALGGSSLFAQDANSGNAPSDSQGSTSAPPDTPYAVAAEDANSSMWQKTTYEEDASGQWVPKIKSYTEIATGMHYRTADGNWLDSVEAITPLPDGTAQAVQGQHQAYFPADIYSGVIQIVTPDGEQIQSRPIGLSYFDGTNSVLIAQLTNSVGQLVSSNQLIYTNAFTDLSADLLITYRKSGVECDLVFRSQIPAPELFGMDSANPGTRLELLTEFFNTSTPEVIATNINPESGLLDSTLAFGSSMAMVQGRAFQVGMGGSSAQALGMGVSKTWLPNIGGRTVLIEELPYRSISPSLSALSPAAALTTNSVSPNSPLYKVSVSRLLPSRRVAQASTNAIRVAKADPIKKPSVIMDWNLVVSQSNMTFRADTTYYVSGAVNLSGTNYFEGGTVLKYTNNASVNLQIGVLNFDTAAYRPAVFTSKDDNTVGETIPGSTGNPASYYANPALSFPGSANTNLISGFRIAWAAQAINTFAPLICRDGQLINCQSGITTEYRLLSTLNMLFANVATNFTVLNQTVIAQNATFSSSSCLAQFTGAAYVALNNCILANVTNLLGGYPGQQINGDHNGFYNSSEFGSNPSTNAYPFQTKGAGSYYLSSGCSFTNAGTTNIDPTLLAELAQKTVFPPILYSSIPISTNIELAPQAPRDTNTPSLGYHYDPLDWCFGGVTVSSNVTVDAGTAIGWFETVSGNGFGVKLSNDSTNRFNGTVTAPCVFARYDTVQEGNGNWNLKGSLAGITTVGTSGYFAEIDAVFTHCYGLATDPSHFRDYIAKLDVHANHSEFYSGALAGYWLGQYMTNCLYYATGQYGSQQRSDGLFWRNCTFHEGQVFIIHSTDPTWPVWIENCAFDATTNYTMNGTNTYCNYNAFMNGAQRLIVQGSNDVVVTNTFTWQPGTLGNFYQSSTDGLFEAGSVSATNIGLYHFTTQTNQTPEGTNKVTIGYHYVALTNGTPLDFTGDGTPDYIADSNGDGVYEPGVDYADWLLGIDTQPQSQNVVQGTNVTFSVVAGGLTPFSYQWQLNGSAISGGTNSNLTLLVVTAGNEGDYSVVVGNSSGSVTSSPAAVLTVNDPLIISNSPSSVTNVQYGTNSFGVILGGHHAVCQWYGPSGSLTNGIRVSGATTTNVTISNLALSDAGNYYFVATNLFNCVTSAPAMLTIITNPALVTPPGNLTNIQADDVTLAVDASGVGLLYQWWLTNSLGTNPIFGATNAWYTQLVVQTNDAGIYGVVVSNLAGSVITNGSLTVLVPPWFTSQPVSITNNTGATATFSATAFGTTNLSYQWFKNGTTLAGQTSNVLTLSNITTNDAAGYFLVVSNIAGTNRSAWAWLSVISNGVTSNGWGTNSSPPISSNSVVMISPTNIYSTNPAIYLSPTNISIRASATSQYDYITNVIFYSSTNLAAVTNFALFTKMPTPATQNTNITFGYAWTNASPGTNLLLAIGTDNKDLSVTSSIVYVVMDVAPTVLVGPNQTNVWPPGTTSTNFMLAGVVTDDGLPFGVTNAQWTVVSGSGGIRIWSPGLTNTSVTVSNYGAYTLQLRGDDGFATNYNQCMLVLQPPPTISITSPTNNSVILTRTSFVLSANAYGSNSTVTNVQFYNGTNPLGTATMSTGNNYNFAWTNAPLWTNWVTAVAKDNNGLSTTSSVVSVVIVPPIAVWITSPTNGQLFVDSPTNILLTATVSNFVANATTTGVSFYNQLVNLGAATATNSGSGTNWQLSTWGATNGTYTIWVVANDNAGNTATNSLGIIVNAMPVVSITNPATSSTNLASFLQGANVTNSGVATDTDGGVTNVTLYCSETKIWSTNFSPPTNYALFSFVTNHVVGIYPVMAVATDDRGASGVSGICLFKVTNTDIPPFIQITYPTNGATFPPGSDITITAMATATSPASVTNVEFFVNGQSIGSDSEAPYEITECCWEPGTYVIQAIATDSTGAWSVTTNITITITPYVPVGQGFWDPVFGQFATAILGPFCDTLDPDSITFGTNGTIYIGPWGYDACDTSPPFFATQGTNWLEMSGAGGQWNGLLADGTNIYGGGRLYAGTEGNVEVWNGTEWSLLGNGLDVTYYIAFAKIGGDLYAAGDFDYAGGSFGYPIDTNVQRIARLDTVSNRWVSVGNGITNGTIFAIAAVGNMIYVGGSFTNAGGNTNANYVACLENGSWTNLGSGISSTVPLDDLDTRFDNGQSGPFVTALAACGGQLFVGGNFDTAGDNTNANGIAVWSDGEWDTIGNGVGLDPVLSYDNITNHYISAIVARGNQIFVGGRFTNVLDSGENSVAVNNIAMATWSEAAQSWSWSDLDQGAYIPYSVADGGIPSGWVDALAIEEGITPNSFDLYVGGNFTLAGSGQIPSECIARWRVGYPAPPSLPIVTITSPSNPTILTNPPAIVLVGLATSPGDYTNIQSANFYSSGAVVGVRSNYPTSDTNYFTFSNEWVSPSPGLYLVNAIATDEAGMVGESTPLVVNIKSTNNPVVAIDDQYTIVQGVLTATLRVLTNDSPSSGLVITNVTKLSDSLGAVTISRDGTYLTYNPLSNVFGTDIFYYTVTDTNGHADSASVTVNILPAVRITEPSDSSRYVVSSPPITVITTANGYTNVALCTNGTVYTVLTNNGGDFFTTNWTASVAGYYTFVAVATDNEGLASTSAPVTLVLTNTTPSSGHPIAAITNLSDTTNVNYGVESDNFAVISNGFFELLGNASDSDSNLSVAYNVTLYQPQDYDLSISTDLNDVIEAATPYADLTPGAKNAQGYHIGGDVSGDLGRLDMTAIPNGVYDLVLRVRGGTDETNAIVRVQLQSNLKIGQFSFSEQDLVLPVNGIPLTVTRTYDSLNSDSGPFGTSWAFALNDLDVQLDEQRTDITIGNDDAPYDDDPTSDNALPKTVSMRTGGGWDVTLTLPNGQRTTFQFSYTGSWPTYYAQWDPPPGVKAKLEPINASDTEIDLGLNGVSIPEWKTSLTGLGNAAPFDNQDFPGWILTTTTDGTRYYITRQSTNDIVISDPNNPGYYMSARCLGAPKLTRIQPISGDSIVIGDTGIFHYDAANNLTRAILFDYDSQGRITALHDPNGGSNGLPAVQYIYDKDNNNLVQVLKLVDRNNGIYTTNKYDYNNPNFPHYITSMENGDGIPVAQNFYDDSGRLTAVQDANGTKTYFNHSTTNNTDIVVDRLGNTNSYVYDLNGNVIWQTNALGQVTASTYGDPNNPTLETAVTNAYGTAVATWALFAYDGNGNKTEIVSMGHTNSFSYDGSGHLLSQIDPLGNVTSNIYDDLGNLTNTIQYDANYHVVSQSFSVYSNGYLAQTLNANNQVTGTFVYDGSGNLTNTTDANGLTRSFAYDENGNQTNSSYEWTPPGGGSSTNVTMSTYYDAQNRVTQAVDALGNTNSTFYDSAGRVAYTIDKFGNTNSMLYDALGNLIQTTYPNGTVTRTVYDPAGWAYLTTDRNFPGNVTSGTMTLFDAQGRATNVIRLTNVVVNITYSGSVAESVAITTNGPISTNSTVYDAAGRVMSRTSPDGTMSYDYYPDGQVMHVTDPLTNITFYGYDIAGRQTNMVDALNHTNKLQYDAVGRTIATIYNDNSYVSNVFNNLGQRVQVIDQAQLTTRFGYNISGQLTNVIKPLVLNPDTGGSNTPTWSYIFDTNGNQIATIDPNQHATTNFFDAFSRQLSQRLPGTRTNLATFNSLGQLLTNYDFDGQRTELRYDQYGQLTNTYYFIQGQTHPSNAVSYAYDQLGRVTNIIQLYGTNAADSYAAIGGPPNNMIASKRSPVRALLSWAVRTGPKWGGPSVAFTLLWALLTLVPSGRRLRRMLAEYYLRGGWKALPKFRFRERQISPYKLAKWMPAYFWRAISIITVIVLIVDDPSWNQVFAQCTAPASSNVTNSTLNTRITSYTYDFDGHMTQMNSPEGYINYTYDSATGRLTNTCTAYSSIAYGYDALGRLQTVHVTERNGTPVNEWTTNSYDQVGNRSEVDLPNGVVTQYHYDSLNRLTNMTHQLGTTNLASYTYALNASGRRIGAVEIVMTETNSYYTNNLSWQYDGMYRLVGETNVCSASTASYTNSYVYDLAGNRLTLTQIAGTTVITTNSYDANDELLRAVAQTNGVYSLTNNYAYDSNGSLIGQTNIASTLSTNIYSYDLRNKLSSVTSGNSSAISTTSFQYNDQGIRVRSMGSISNKYYLVDANNHTGYQQVLEEFSTLGGTPTMSYVIGDDVLGQSTSGSAYYLLADGHSSTRQMVSDAGGITSRYNYDAYGITQTGTSTSSADTSLCFCREQYDSALQMYNLRARYYSPNTGRFNQRDAFAGNSSDPQSLHKYVYCQCDAINNVDPTGNFLLLDLMISISYRICAFLTTFPAIMLAIRFAMVGMMVILCLQDRENVGLLLAGGVNPATEAGLLISDVRSLSTEVYLESQVPPAVIDSLAGDLSSQTERAVVDETQQILNSPELAKLRAAYQAGTPVTVNINGRVIQYEPTVSPKTCGMAFFGGNFFVLGPGSFTSDEELTKTFLHELYRLSSSVVAINGVSGDVASQETAEAYAFADRAYQAYFKK